MRRRQIIGFAAGLALFLPLAFLGQVSIPSREKANQKPPDEIPRPDLRVDRTEVLVPVAVNDAYNRPVAGLEKENFRVLDDKLEQVITSFSMEDEPVAVGLVFDTSGSMSGAEREEHLAATEFFKTANPEDERRSDLFDRSVCGCELYRCGRRSEQHLGADGRPYVQVCGRTPVGYRSEDQRGSSQSVSTGLRAQQYGAQWEVSPGGSEGSS